MGNYDYRLVFLMLFVVLFIGPALCSEDAEDKGGRSVAAMEPVDEDLEYLAEIAAGDVPQYAFAALTPFQELALEYQLADQVLMTSNYFAALNMLKARSEGDEGKAVNHLFTQLYYSTANNIEHVKNLESLITKSERITELKKIAESMHQVTKQCFEQGEPEKGLVKNILGKSAELHAQVTNEVVEYIQKISADFAALHTARADASSETERN